MTKIIQFQKFPLIILIGLLICVSTINVLAAEVTFEADVFIPAMPSQNAGDPVCIDLVTGQLVAGCDGAVGPPGTSSWTDGEGIVTTTDRVGIGTTTSEAKLTVAGEMRAVDSSGAPRLWGQGRPDAIRYGPILGSCTNLNVKFGLSNAVVNWGSAAAACPAGTWVCTSEERGDSACNTARPDSNTIIDALHCDGSEIHWPESDHWGWLADNYLSHPRGRVSSELGVTGNSLQCLYYPVWCCEPSVVVLP